MTSKREARRRGFTLVEVMVAAALTLFIMAIISEAFITGLETFTQLKAIGDMEDNLRTAVVTLRNDLQLDHFEAKRRLSDPTFGNPGNPPIREGFFRIQQGATALLEASDIDPYGYASYRATSHVIHFSAKARGNRRENFFTAPLGTAFAVPTNFFGQPTDAFYMDGTTFNSQWAEIAYYLVQVGTTVNPLDPTSGGTPLYTLYRVQLPVLPRTDQVNGTIAASLGSTTYANLSCSWNTSAATNTVLFYSPNDLVNPANRTFNPSNPGTRLSTLPATGVPATPLLTNVVSFLVRVLPSGNPPLDFVDLSANANFGNLLVFDTSNPGTNQILAIQISLRIWEQKTQQSRQITFIQDM